VHNSVQTLFSYKINCISQIDCNKITQKSRWDRQSISFKVTDVSTNRKHVSNFLLVWGRLELTASHLSFVLVFEFSSRDWFDIGRIPYCVVATVVCGKLSDNAVIIQLQNWLSLMSFLCFCLSVACTYCWCFIIFYIIFIQCVCSVVGTHNNNR